MSAALRVVSPGLMTTVQDLGRVGYQRLGIPVGGALDSLSLRAANLMVGNPPDAGALEIVVQGPVLKLEGASARIGLAGAEAEVALLDEALGARQALGVGRSVRLRGGDVVRVGALSRPGALYLAVEGGFDIPPALGSLSTYLRGGFGGWQGRALAPDDLLPLAKGEAPERAELVLDARDLAPIRRFRVLEGPQGDYLSPEERELFFRREYVVGFGWSRMGMRLEGEKLRLARGHDVASDGVVRGSIQVPGDGLPIVLLAEHQTTGGYPKIGVVISADLPALGRVGPGSKIGFELVTLEEAEAAARAFAAVVEKLPARLAPLAPAPPLDLAARLREANLVSGVIDAQAFLS